MAQSRTRSVQSVRFNIRAVVVVAATAAAIGLGLFFLNSYQERRASAAVLDNARRLHKAGEADLAVRQLNQHLALRPTDVDALELRSLILYEVARGPEATFGAAKAQEQFLRVAPDVAGSQDARRRLVELYVRYGEANRSIAKSQSDIELVTLESRFRAAELVARQLIARGAHDAGAHRLLAMALDGLAVPGDRKALEDAVREYRTVLTIDPGDVEAAERLAALYQDRLKDLTRAEHVLDELLHARPDSAEVRLVRYRFYVKSRRDERAATELEEATRLAPGDLKVIVAAAEHALRRGDIAGARRQLAKVPESSRSDLRVLLTDGMINFYDEQPDEAVDAWRKGLAASSGTSDEMTWWLAYSLLQIGRVAEARPLLSQYKRLAYEGAPLLRFLEALQDERNGKPAQAIATLGQIRNRLEPRWETLVLIARGRCYEALWDETKALDAYARAIQSDPFALVPRLAVARLRLKRDYDGALDDLRRALDMIPGDPAIQIALASALLHKEAARPASRRSWSEFDAALAKLAAALPDTTAVRLLQVDRLSLSGREADALKLLTETAEKAPGRTPVALALANALSSRGEHARALEVLRRAASPAAAGDQAGLRIAQARTLVALNRGREAREALVLGAETLPSSDQSQVWTAVGQIETARGDADAARRAYTEWARLVPDDPRPRLVLFDLAFEQADEPAIHALVDEIRKVSGVKELTYRLARAKELLWERDASHPPEGSRDTSLEEAANLVEGVLSDASELPAARLLKAQVLERQGRIDESIAAYQVCWDRGIEAALPGLIELLTRKRKFDSLLSLRTEDGKLNSQVDLLSAQAFLKVGETSRAFRAADQLVKDQPDSAETSRWQARMLDHLGRVEDAEAALRAIAERQPGRLEPWLDLLRFQAGHKRTDAARETIARVKAAVKIDPPERLEALCRWATGDLPAARKAFDAAIAARPDDIPLRLEAARFLEEAERPIEAEAALRDVLRLDPKNRPAGRQLAVILATHASDPASWDRAWAALGAENEEPDDRLAAAVVLSRCPDPVRRASAINRLEELIADLPARHTTAKAARDFLARLLLDANQSARASQVAAVSAGQGTDPASISLYARALIQSKKPEAAAWQLDRLAAINPGDLSEASLRARVIWDRSRPVEAADALVRAYDIRADAPGSEELGREAFLLLSGMGNDFNAISERLARNLAARNPALSWCVALILARGSRNDEAFAMLQAAARAGRTENLLETARVAMTLAVDSDDAETLAKADAVLNATQSAAPHSDELAIMTAMLRHIQGKYAEEVRLYKAVLEHRPENPVILNNLAWALCEGSHLPAEALPLIEASIQVEGHTPQALDTRGVILTRLGRLDAAIHDLEEVVSREPTALHQLHLARAYKLAGRADDALKSRTLAHQVGVSPKDLDPVERPELQALLKP